MEKVPVKLKGMDWLQELTGFSRSFIYEHTRNGSPDPLPHYRFGKRLYFNPDDIYKWIAHHKIGSKLFIASDLIKNKNSDTRGYRRERERGGISTALRPSLPYERGERDRARME